MQAQRPDWLVSPARQGQWGPHWYWSERVGQVPSERSMNYHQPPGQPALRRNSGSPLFAHGRPCTR